jgi:hypothetical protein
MKKIFSIIVLSTLLFSCSKTFLDKEPEDALSSGAFFKTAEDIKTGVVAVYQPLHNIFVFDGLPQLVERMSDDGTEMYGQADEDRFFKTNANSFSGLWNNFYKMIVNANNIIGTIDDFVPKNDEEAVIINASRGEACFLRALAYFYLVRLYGDVPKVVERFEDPSTAFGIGRATVSSIYTDVIIPDLIYASENCYKKGDAALSGEEARATRGSALTILGKVYLTMNDHTNAAATLKKLIVDKVAGNYSLVTNYADIWLPTNKFNSESVFEVNYNVGAGVPSYYFHYMTNENAYFIGGLTNCWGALIGEKILMDEFFNNQEWTRYSASVDSGFNPNQGYPNPIPMKLIPPKYELPPFNLTGTDNNYMITRYADALLMYAEALMEINQADVAVGYVNEVRGRANMTPIDAADLNIDRILHERRMELAFEGHRYFDLVRTGKAISVLSEQLMSGDNYFELTIRTSPIPDYQLLLPIPTGEIEKDNTLLQNPGY